MATVTHHPDRRAALRPAAFLAALAAIFGGAMAIGSAVGDGGEGSRSADHAVSDGVMADMAGGRGAEHGDAAAAGDGHGEHGAAAPAPTTAHGLGVAENGVRLVAPATARAGVREHFAFRIVDGHGETVRDFAIEHTKRLHLIAVRRDLTGFQHLHPRQAADGAWSTDLTLRARGATAGRQATLAYTVTRNGRSVAVQPYLGASGHLVALRAGDLAYLHVHPLAGGADAGRIAFAATYPSAGRYRLFLQFRHAGRVHTAALTQEVATA